MIQDFIDSALIIDEKENEISDLKNHLEENEIWVKHYTPENLAAKKQPLKNRKIIFLDLYLDDTKKLEENVSLIRKIFEKNIGNSFGSYGIVLWTKHTEEFDEFKKRIGNNNDKYTLPLFVVKLEKQKYLSKKNWGEIINDINQTLQNDTAAAFFLHWDILVKKGKDKALNGIYSLEKDYNKQEQNLKFLLFQLAKNYTGIPDDKLKDHNLYLDAVKAFSDMLHYEIISDEKVTSKIFDDMANISFSGNDSDKLNIFSIINSKLLIDDVNINQNLPIPGNVYQIIEENNPLKITEVSFRESSKIEIKKVDEVVKNKISIVLEITPPCDFSENKKAKRSRIISGIMFEYYKGWKKYFEGVNYYREVYPIKIKNKENPYAMVFDFRHFISLNEEDLKNTGKYRIQFRTKDKLFADILQKFSTHTARLGLAIIR